MRLITKTQLTTALMIATSGLLLACGGGGGSKQSKAPISDQGTTPTLCGGNAMPTGASCLTVAGRDNLIFGNTNGSYKGLVLMLHGAPGNMAKVSGIFNASMLQQQGYLVITPNGNGGSWEWQSSVNGTDNTDSSYIADLIDFAHANYTIEGDTARILGYSAGGFMAYTLACQIPEKLSGIVALAGQFRGYFDQCTTSTAVAVHHLHSPGDTDVPMAGRTRGNIASVDATIDHWLAINGCLEQYNEVAHPAVIANSAGTTTQNWQGCSQSVSLSKLHEVPHESDYLSDKLFAIYGSTMNMGN